MERIGTARTTEVPEHDDIDLDKELCPPHQFMSAYGTSADGSKDDVPVLFCVACGDIRALKLPA